MSSSWDEISSDDLRTQEMWGQEPQDLPGQQEVPAPQVTPVPTLSRPTGPSWGTVALGLICLAVAGGAFFVEATNLQLDWRSFGPLTLVGLGVLLLLVGLAALLRRGDDSEPDLDS